MLEIPQFAHDVGVWKSKGEIYSGYTAKGFNDLKKMFVGVFDESDYNRVLTVMIQEEHAYEKYVIIKEMIEQSCFEYLQEKSVVRKPMDTTYLLDKLLSKANLLKLLEKHVYVPMYDNMYVNVVGLMLFAIWYKGNFGINLLSKVTDFAYCNVKVINENECLSSDFRSVLLGLVYYSRFIICKQNKNVHEVFGEWEHNLVEGKGVGYYANILSTFDYKYGGVPHAYYSVGIAHTFRLIYIDDVPIHYSRALNKISFGFVRYWVYNNPLLLIPKRTKDNIICAHSMYQYYDEFLGSMKNDELNSMRKVLEEFYDNEILINNERENIINERYELPDEIYDKLQDCFLDVICERLGYGPYVESREHYKQYLKETIEIIHKAEGNESFKYNLKRKMYECAPIKSYFAEHLKRSEVGALKNFYGFFYPLIKRIDLYSQINTIYFVGCGDSKWYSMLADVLFDKQIVYVDINKIYVKAGTHNVSTYVGDMSDIIYEKNSYMYFDVYSKDDKGKADNKLLQKVLGLITNIDPLLYSYKYFVEHEKAGECKLLFKELFIMPFTRFGTYEMRCWGGNVKEDCKIVMSRNIISYYICYHWMRQRGLCCIDCKLVSRLMEKFHIVHYQMKNLIKKADITCDLYYKDYGNVMDYGNICRHSIADLRIRYLGSDFNQCCYLNLMSKKISPQMHYNYFRWKDVYVNRVLTGQVELELHVKTKRRLWCVMIMDSEPNDKWNDYLIGF